VQTIRKYNKILKDKGYLRIVVKDNGDEIKEFHFPSA
jgi:hypothetical protein